MGRGKGEKDVHRWCGGKGEGDVHRRGGGGQASMRLGKGAGWGEKGVGEGMRKGAVKGRGGGGLKRGIEGGLG